MRYKKIKELWPTGPQFITNKKYFIKNGQKNHLNNILEFNNIRELNWFFNIGPTGPNIELDNFKK